MARDLGLNKLKNGDFHHRKSTISVECDQNRAPFRTDGICLGLDGAILEHEAIRHIVSAPGSRVSLTQEIDPTMSVQQLPNQVISGLGLIRGSAAGKAWKIEVRPAPNPSVGHVAKCCDCRSHVLLFGQPCQADTLNPMPHDNLDENPV